MSRFHRQFAAAAAVHDHMSPPDYGDRDPSDALDAIETRLIKSGDVGELLADLHGGGDTFGALDRLMCGRPALPGDAAYLQTLWRRLKSINEDVEREMEA